MEATSLQKMTKAQFEALLYSLNNGAQISARRFDSYDYENGKTARLTLYYNTEGVHMGTWQRSGNCVFIDSCYITAPMRPYLFNGE